MKNTTITLELLTPCFCAGADQARAEVRAPSIRGQLRWWFRVLGGTPEQEKRVFGGVHGDAPAASAIVIRVRSEANGAPVQLPRPNEPLYYLFHFAKASGRGLRYTEDGYLSPKTQFSIDTVVRRSLASDDGKTLDAALVAFRRLGSLGLRQTRGLGAFADSGEQLALADFAGWAASLAPRVEVCWAIGPDGKPVLCESPRDALEVLESCLRALRGRYPAKGPPSPLGSSTPRQASGVHLRPVRLADGVLPVVFFAEATLEARSRTRGFRLAGFRFPRTKGTAEDHCLGP